MKTIFVAIAAYNEPYVEMMIDNCLENAEYPERIKFGIWFHHSNMEKPDFSKYNNVKVIYVNHDYPLGVGVARLGCNFMYSDEDYYLQLDAHMLFQHHWDSKLIQHHDELKEKYEKPIISTYTRWWSKTEDTVNFYSNQDTNNSSPMILDYEKSIAEKYPKPKNSSVPWLNQRYIEHYFISAHFLFAEKNFLYDVMPDPLILFGGEEITTAVRAWTRGYRIFTVSNPIAWHLNKGDGDLFDKDIRKIPKNNPEMIKFFYKEKLGKIRSKDILLGTLLGYWGAKDLNSLKEYENLSGIKFKEIYEKINLEEING